MPGMFGFRPQKPRFDPFETINAVLPGQEEEDPFQGEEIFAEPGPGMDWFGRSSSARDSYLDHLAGMPQRPNVGTGRKILASIIGGLAGATQGLGAAGGLQNEIMFGGYNRDLADWGARGKALKEAADVERDENRDVLAEQGMQSQIERRRAQSENDSLQRQLKERDLNMREERNEQLHQETMRRIENMENQLERQTARDAELKRHERENEQIGRERNILSKMNYDWKKAYQGATLDDKENPLIKPYAQKSIREMAKETIGQDPAFSSYYKISPQGIRMFDLQGEKDPAKKSALAKLIKRRLKEAEAQIISTRYKDYFNFDEFDDEGNPQEKEPDLDTDDVTVGGY